MAGTLAPGGLRAQVAPGAAQARQRISALFTLLTTRRVSEYGTAFLRLGYGLAYLAFLLREFPHRDTLWGPGAAWTPAMDHGLAANASWPGLVKAWYTLLATNSNTLFQLEYALALLICLLMALGLYTRATSCAFALVVTAFSGRDILLTDGGDSVLIVMSLYLVFTACGRRMSLDSRSAATRRSAQTRTLTGAWAELAEVRRRSVTLMHNAAVLVIGGQMCVIYGAAALWKVQGATWQNGTALYYVLHTDWFRVWPGLSDSVAGHAQIIAVVAYVTVFAQIGFPFLVLTRRPKYVLICILLGMHLSIAVCLGLPMFSAAMIIGDAVFLPEAFWPALGRLLQYIARQLTVDRLRPLATQAPYETAKTTAASTATETCAAPGLIGTAGLPDDAPATDAG